MMVKTKIGVLVKLQDKNQSKSERKLLKNGFSINKMQTKTTPLFTIFAILLVYLKKKLYLCTLFARGRALDTIYNTKQTLHTAQNKHYTQHKTNTEYKQ